MNTFQNPPEDPKFKTALHHLRYWPASELSLEELRLLVWLKTKELTKEQIKELIDETGQELQLINDLNESTGWRIYWLYNRIPPLTEWISIEENARFIASYRISPALGKNSKIVVLSQKKLK